MDDTPIIGAVNDDTKGMDVDVDVADLEGNADLEVEEDEADEEVSQQDEEAQPIKDAGEGDDEPCAKRHRTRKPPPEGRRTWKPPTLGWFPCSACVKGPRT